MKYRVCICCGETRPVGDFIRAPNPNVCEACLGFLEDIDFIRKTQPPLRKHHAEGGQTRQS